MGSLVPVQEVVAAGVLAGLCASGLGTSFLLAVVKPETYGRVGLEGGLSTFVLCTCCCGDWPCSLDAASDIFLPSCFLFSFLLVDVLSSSTATCADSFWANRKFPGGFYRAGRVCAEHVQIKVI